MKKSVFTFISIFYITILSAQTDFNTGYYIVNSGAKYAVLSPAGSDFILDIETGNYSYPITDEIDVNVGVVVIVYEIVNGKALAFDPSGKQIVFENINSLTKAPNIKGSGICNLLESIQLIDGSTLNFSDYYWVIGQDVSKSTIRIQVNDNKTYDVPQDKVLLLGALLKRQLKDIQLKSAVE